MPTESFRGDPYRVLGLDPQATGEEIKRRWRELAREHHPDRAAEDRAEADRLTARMARINAAYDLLRDPQRRATHDATRRGDRPRTRTEPGATARHGAPFQRGRPDAPAGPPPPRPARPVTARFDTTQEFLPRNQTTVDGRTPLGGQVPLSNRERHGGREELRASHPNGPVHKRTIHVRGSLPTLDEAIATPLAFGKYEGHTLGEVATFEPTYIDWIAGTVTRDRELVLKARVIQAELDRQGVERRTRPPRPGWGRRAEEATPA